MRVCAGWSEPLLVSHTTLLKISCRGSNANGSDKESKVVVCCIPPCFAQAKDVQCGTYIVLRAFILLESI